MLAQPDAIRAVGRKWFYSKVREHREPGRRFMLHGVLTWFFLSRRAARPGIRSAQVRQLEARVAAARKRSSSLFPRASVGSRWNEFGEKFDRLKKIKTAS
nr:hypothetical protein [Paraburkholderia sp. SG-MS1]